MMDLKNSETEYLLAVLRAAVKGEKAGAPPQEMDWQAFFELSKRQEVYSMIAQSIDFQYLPPDIARQLNDYAKSELVRLIAMQNELHSIEDELAENGIKYMLLKGAVIRNYYPKQSMRQMSDIDILYDPAKREILVDLMKRRGYELMTYGENSDDFTKKPFYTFEFHRELFKDQYGFYPDFSFVWRNAECSGSNGFAHRMRAEDLYLHHIAHMYKHGILGGFGVRFLADTYLIVSKEQNTWNREYIDQKLAEFSLSDFEEQVRRISFSILEGKALSDADARFFHDKIGFGVYGNQRVAMELAFNKFKEEKGRKSFLSYVFYRLFPGLDFMRIVYPVLNNRPYLLWFYYLVRLFTKSGRSIKKAKSELKTVKDISKEQKNQNNRGKENCP